MEDVDYLRTHGETQSFVFMIDSKLRDKAAHPTPSEYAVPFVHPFTNVVGIEVLEASVPRTNYNVDDDTCTLSCSENGGPFVSASVPTGDYDVLQLCKSIGAQFAALGLGVTVAPTSNPPEIKSTLTFTGPRPFVLDMAASTMSEVLGFDANAQPRAAGYACVYGALDIADPGGDATADRTGAHVKPRQFASLAPPANGGAHVLVAPGIFSLVGDRYILLRCKEIEGSRATVSDNYSQGIAKFRLGVVGYANTSMDFVNGGSRAFHPIGRLTRLSLRFERPGGDLYNFRGVNHTLTLVLRFVVPRREGAFVRSSLNPNYDGNFQAWPRTDEEREGDSDEETDAYNQQHAPLKEAARAEGAAHPANEAAARQELIRTLFE